MGRYLSDAFPFQNSLKLDYGTMQVRTTQDELKLSGRHQLVVYTDVNLMGENIQTVQESTQVWMKTLDYKQKHENCIGR